MLSRVFTTEDTTLYSSWSRDEGGLVTLFIPGMGELRMTFAKAEEVSAAIARQAEYGRWDAMEEKHKTSQEKHTI